jgi:hypothetical protein
MPHVSARLVGGELALDLRQRRFRQKRSIAGPRPCFQVGTEFAEPKRADVHAGRFQSMCRGRRLCEVTFGSGFFQG